MRKIILFIMLIPFFAAAKENVYLSGRVIDESNQALANVHIEEINNNISFTTSSDGEYLLTLPSNVELELKVSANGYNDKYFSIKLKDEEIRNFNIELSRNVTIDEITVTANQHYETARYAVHIPSKLEKKHSNSGYSLISVMNLPDLRADNRSQSISNINGQQLVVLVNGVEADANQITTLQPQDILRVEYQRVPSGKWATSAGVVNFIVKQWKYGGNFLVSADECFGYESGNYLAYFNYAQGNTVFVTTINGKWAHNRDVGSFGTEIFDLNSLHFSRERKNIKGEVKENSQSAQFMIQNITVGHTFKGNLLLSRKATPKRTSLDELNYTGAFENMNAVQYRESDQSALSPTLSVDYTKYLAGGKNFNLSGEVSYSHSNYKSIYQETKSPMIENKVLDDTWQLYGQAYYQMTLPHKIYLTGMLSHRHSFFKDKYSGNTNSTQNLNVGGSIAGIQLYHTVNDKFYYYLLAGASNNLTHLNGKTINYLYPMMHYGINYTFNSKNSISFKGHYTDTNYSPTYQNEAILQNTFFEYTVGNPNLKATKVYQHDLSYNTTIKRVKLSMMYSLNAYFDNTFNIYQAVDDKLYQTMRNEGNFFSNKVIASASWNTVNEKLRLRLTGYFDHINTNGGIYRNSMNRVWIDASAMYMFHDFMISASYSSPHDEFWIYGPYRGSKNDSYSVELSWHKGAWNASFGALNFLDTKREQHRYYDYGIYSTDMRNFSRAQGRNIFVTLSYAISYGRKTDKINSSAQPKTTDAIMRTF